MPSAERSYRRRRPGVNHLYQGMTLDAVTGLHDERARDDLPSLGRWIEQTALRYINGANTYQFVGSSPVGMVDAEGTQWTVTRDGKALAVVADQKRHTVASMRLYACDSAWPVTLGLCGPSPATAWKSNVSKLGWFTGWSGEFNNLRYWFNVERVRVHERR